MRRPAATRHTETRLARRFNADYERIFVDPWSPYVGRHSAGDGHFRADDRL